MRPSAFVLVTALFILAVGVGHAGVFMNPPETYAPGWDDPYPYQRNAFIGFDSNPATWPTDPTGPTGNWDLTPYPPVSNYQLFGTHDLLVYESDWLHAVANYSGNPATISWEATDSWFDSDREGLIVFEAPWNQTLVVDLYWKLDNVPGGDLKHMYDERIFAYSGTLNSWFWRVDPGDGKWVHQEWNRMENISGRWYVYNSWVDLEPNPEWEIIHTQYQLRNSATTGTYGFKPTRLVFDSWHGATVCYGDPPPNDNGPPPPNDEPIPEPTTLALFAVGIAGVILWRRRKSG